MMTNMTFTKGIGTPKYMAPEILNREHYKMASDIYSYSITMLQIITFQDHFLKKYTIFHGILQMQSQQVNDQK